MNTIKHVQKQNKTKYWGTIVPKTPVGDFVLPTGLKPKHKPQCSENNYSICIWIYFKNEGTTLNCFYWDERVYINDCVFTLWYILT